MAAYSEAADVSAATLSPASLSKAVIEAAQVLGASPDKVKVRLPERLQGYSNTFVLALLLPLIENALDAVPENKRVVAFAEDREAEFRIVVRNALSSESGFGVEVYEPGYTSKESHDGLGLAAVRRLLATRSGSLSHEFDDGDVRFIVSLPKVVK